MNKKEIRTNILNEKEKLSKEDIHHFNSQIYHSLIKNPLYLKSKNIMIYLSFSKEVDTHNLIKYSLSIGKNILVPITYPKENIIRPSILKDFSHLEIGHYNILAPKEEFIEFFPANEIDLVIVPGVAFNLDGYRIGYGGGYYDRFLSSIPNVDTIALLYSMQLVDFIPINQYDIPVRLLITEDNTYFTKK